MQEYSGPLPDTPPATMLLPLLGPPSVVAGFADAVVTAGADDISDPALLDHVLWPQEILDEVPSLADQRTEVRRLSQIITLSDRGLRVDLRPSPDVDVSVESVFPTPATSVSVHPAGVHFAGHSAADDARRYLQFLDEWATIRNGRPPAVVRLANLVAEDVYRGLAEAASGNMEYRRDLMDRLAVSGRAADIRWDRFRTGASGLAILYNFAPFADTGSTVASKRLRDFARTMDVISCSWVNHKKVDPTVGIISRPYIGRQSYLDLRPSWASWEAYEEFCREGMDQIASWKAEGQNYDLLYSRANWASSHYLATAYKQQNPDIEWVAEFSDPLSLDVEGSRRGDALDRNNAFLADLVAPVEAEYGRIPDDHFTIFGLAEILPYALAETVLFTNEHQMASMLEHVYSPALVERVRRHAEVSNHPTLPPVYYSARTVDYKVDPTKLNLAYFGEFYATRGITDLTVALKMLSPEMRDHVHLHVFTNFVPEGGLASKPAGFSQKSFKALVKRAQDGVGAHGIEHLVTFNASLPFLEFLGVTAAFDYLIVNDAHSGPNHQVNPFLPSKWSDYAGSEAAAWALVEDGSILSGKPARVKTPVGDPNAAREMLWKLIEDKKNRVEGRIDD